MFNFVSRLHHPWYTCKAEKHGKAVEYCHDNMTQPHVWPNTEADHVMPSQVFGATTNSPSSSPPAHTVHHTGSSASTLREALTRPLGRRFISHVVAQVRGIPSLWTLPLSPSVQFWCCVPFLSSVYHDETLTDQFSRSKSDRSCEFWAQVVDGPRNFPSPRHQRGRWNYHMAKGVLLTVCEHTHTHTPTPQMHFQLDGSRGAVSYNTRRQTKKNIVYLK